MKTVVVVVSHPPMGKGSALLLQHRRGCGWPIGFSQRHDMEHYESTSERGETRQMWRSGVEAAPVGPCYPQPKLSE